MGRRPRDRFICQQCGYETGAWLGRCPNCNSWNSLIEERRAVPVTGTVLKTASLSGIEDDLEARRGTGSAELDRVLGGGAVAGSVILIGGDPGIGKSTLLLQVAAQMSASGSTVIYVSGEESLRQLSRRARRLGLGQADLQILGETDVSKVEATLLAEEPNVAVIDSVQTLFDPEFPSAPGSVGQVRECTARLQRLAKQQEMVLFLVGHVTKTGDLAGPRVLEHVVDTVLYFEGERNHAYRVLRATKNRFGSTNEIGVFEMTDSGLLDVSNPSRALLAQRPLGAPGSVVTMALEGTRPLLVEVQALVAPSAFGLPRRTASGIDHNRFALLLAVLERRVGLVLGNQDAYVKVAGGLRLDEPAADLALVLAVASSYRGRAIEPGTAVAGEVGLTGEVRLVNGLDLRIREAAKLGFAKCLVPATGLERLGVTGVELAGVSTVEEALAAMGL